jgi:hypothetical protein
MGTAPMQMGQAFTGRLIYTTSGVDDRVWCVDSERRHFPLGDLPLHHPGLTLPCPPGEMRSWLATRAKGNWRPTGREHFVTGSDFVRSHALLAELKAFICRHVVCSAATRLLLATYILVTYVYCVASTVPYLLVVGETNSGKSLLGEILQHLCFNAYVANSGAVDAACRLADSIAGTTIFDEERAGGKTWKQLLMSGNRAAGAVLASSWTIPRHYRVFGPKVFCLREELGDQALESRMIRVALEPGHRRPDGSTNLRMDSEASELRDQLHAFGLSAACRLHEILESRVALPDVTSQEDDLAALPLSIARLVDESAAGESHVERELAQFFQNLFQTRNQGDLFNSERAFLARAVLESVHDPVLKKSLSRALGSWVLAADFTDFVNAHRDAPCRYPARVLGERLQRYGLILERKTLPVAAARNTGDGNAPIGRVQGRAYRFDIRRAENLSNGSPTLEDR